MARQTKQRGFTLLELLVVVVVIATMTLIAIPGLLNSLHRAKQKSTMKALRSIATALESYSIDTGAYPAIDGATQVLVAPLQPSYMKFVPTTDSWGHEMLYADLDPDADDAEYILWSLGKDGVDDGNDGRDGETTKLNADIVIFDGRFTQWPAGYQE